MICIKELSIFKGKNIEAREKNSARFSTLITSDKALHIAHENIEVNKYINTNNSYLEKLFLYRKKVKTLRINVNPTKV